MKKGITIGSFPRQSLKENFLLAKKAGFDGVEVALDLEGEINMNSTAEDMQPIKAMAEELGLEFYGVTTDLHWRYNLVSDDQEERDMAKAVIRKEIDVAAWLGCGSVLVVPGSVGVDRFPDWKLIDYDIALKRSFEAIKELSAYAEEKKVIIGIENVVNKFLLSPVEVRSYLDGIGSDYVGMYFDAGNILRFGYPEMWIRILGERIKRIHIKDFNKGSSSFVSLLEGNINFPSILKELDAIGYDGWITAEVGPVNSYYPERLVYATSEAMDLILEGRR